MRIDFQPIQVASPLGGGASVFAAGVSAFVLVAALFLSSCTDEETVTVPGPTVTVPGPTVTTTVEVPADIKGTDEADDLSGSLVDDVIDGMAGDDTIQGGDGDDELMGGDGDDEISGGTITENTIEPDSTNPAVMVAKAVKGCARGADPDGMDGADIIRGGDGDDRLYGGSGDDMIYGEGGDDTVCGNSGNDELMGGDGDDVLDGGPGDDDMVGGDGDDLVDYSSAKRAITVDLSKPGNMIRDGLYGRDTISGIERIKGSPHDDTFTGDGSDNTFMPGAGKDTLDGGAGSDTLDYSDATATQGLNLDLIRPDADSDGNLDCAAGTTENPATETIITVGGESNPAVGDKIRAPHGKKDKDGGVTCLSSIENLVGGAGNDLLNGDSQDNVLVGGPGNDEISGHGGDDVLKGGPGDDERLFGGSGDDIIYGGAGNNMYIGDAGDDTFYVTNVADVDSNGGVGVVEQADAGTDTLSLAMYAPDPEPTGTAAVFTVTLEANVDNLVGSKYNDSLTGNDLANEIDGGAGNDTVNGGAENDTLTGGAGNDTIDGGAGNDTIDGGPGDDTLTGGEGNDIFIVMMGEGNDNIGSSSDQIAGTDKIQLKGFGAGTTASYRALSGNTGFVITVGSQSIQVASATTFEEDDLKKIVTIE